MLIVLVSKISSMNGSSVSEVQALWGHKSPETIIIYVHTASKSRINIKSPFEDLAVRIPPKYVEAYYIGRALVGIQVPDKR